MTTDKIRKIAINVLAIDASYFPNDKMLLLRRAQEVAHNLIKIIDVGVCPRLIILEKEKLDLILQQWRDSDQQKPMEQKEVPEANPCNEIPLDEPVIPIPKRKKMKASYNWTPSFTFDFGDGVRNTVVVGNSTFTVEQI